MKIEHVKEIANAVLYEGYLLYPYRHSAIKNRQRWTFGAIYPREYSEAQGGVEPWTMRTECLIAGQGNKDTTLDIHVRFLHLLVRSIVQPTSGEDNNLPQAPAEKVGEWSIAGRLANEPREEGVEREISALALSVTDLVANPRRVEIAFPGGRMVERDNQPGHSVPTREGECDESSAEIVREQHPLTGAILIEAALVEKDLYKLSIQIENNTAGTAELTNQHNAALLHSFISTHTILQVYQGSFISLLDPPETVQMHIQSCQNIRTWPVLVGDEGKCDTMLSSPIILYDYPQIAPESPGSLFDGTEIDEILTLRILTLTDEEKQEMRQGDERAREILERTEAISPEQFMKLHGVIRRLRTTDEGDEYE